MYEVKCDVKGCENREQIFDDADDQLSLPPGWRQILCTVVQHTAPSKTPPAFAKLTKIMRDSLGKETADAYAALAESVTPASMPFFEKRVERHVCPDHALPEFEDDDGAV